jgi:hypothetical protein
LVIGKELAAGVCREGGEECETHPPLVGRGVDWGRSFREVPGVGGDEVVVGCLGCPLRQDKIGTADVPEDVGAVGDGDKVRRDVSPVEKRTLY